MSYGTIGADIIQTSGANLAPVFKDLNNNVVGNVVSTDNLTKLSNLNTKQIAKAWVNFDGTLTGTITPRANYNVSSVTKIASGQYTVNFTAALSDANYAVVTNATQSDTNTSYVEWQPRVISFTTTSFRIHTALENSTGGGAADNLRVMCAIFGN